MQNHQDSNTFISDVFVDGQKIFSIPIENIWHQEQPVSKRKRFTNKNYVEQFKTQNDYFQTNNQDLFREMLFNPLSSLNQIKYQGDIKMLKSSEQNQIKQDSKRTGWILKDKNLFNPPHIKIINWNLSQNEFEYFIRLYRLDQINELLEQQEFQNELKNWEIKQIIPNYDEKGINKNTIQNITHNKLLQEKDLLIQECQFISESFIKPKSYQKLKKKFIFQLPQNDLRDFSYQEIIIGNKGNIQKAIEAITGCRVQFQKNKQNECVLIESENQENINNCKLILLRLIKGENISFIARDFNKSISDSRELIAIETVLRDYCENCKEEGHKIWQCPYNINNEISSIKKDKINLLDLVKCSLCNSNFHVQRDCPWLKYANDITKNQDDFEYYQYLRDMASEQFEIKDLDEKTENQQIKFLTNQIQNYNLQMEEVYLQYLNKPYYYKPEQIQQSSSSKNKMTQDEINQIFKLVNNKQIEKVMNFIQNQPKEIVESAFTQISYNNETLIHYLVKSEIQESNVIKIFKELYNKDVYLLNKNTQYESPLFTCVWENKIEILNYFISINCDVNEGNLYKQTPLLIAIELESIQIIQILLKNNANANHRDLQYQSGIFYAILKQNVKICELLFQYNLEEIELGQIDWDKKSPVFYAKQLENEEIINLLIKNGASVSKDGKNIKLDQTKKKKESGQSEKRKVDEQKNKYELKSIQQENSSFNSLDYLKRKFPLTFKYIENISDYLQSEIVQNLLKQFSWKTQAMKILLNLWKFKGASVFHQPVDPLEFNIKDYFAIVKYPMDFSTVRKKLIQNIYQSFQEFKIDMDQVFYNCQLYNGTESHVGQIGIQVNQQYQKLLNSYEVENPQQENEVSFEELLKQNQKEIEQQIQQYQQEQTPSQ